MEVLLAACCVGALQASVVWMDDYFDKARDVATDGNTAYVAAEYSGVLVVDVTNPASPTPLLGVCEECGNAYAVRFSESMLYTVNGSSQRMEVVISDATNPRALSVVGKFACPATEYSCNNLVATGGKVYFPDSASAKVFIVDATNPAAPNLVGTYDTAGPSEVDASGQYLYVASRDGLEVVDVTDPAAPTRVGLFSNNYVSAVLVSGNLVYSSCDSRALCVVDVTDPTSPTRVGSVGTVCRVSSLTLSGTMLYAACLTEGQDLQLIDVSSAASPSVVSQVASNDPYGNPELASTGTTVLAACRKGMLQVIDASVPTAPSSVTLGTYGRSNGVHVAGTVAVVGDHERGTIRLYDVSNPSAATLLSTLDVSEAGNVFILGTHVYVCASTGLSIVDITNPSAPSLVGSKTLTGPKTVWVVGQTAYVTSSSGLSTLDVSDPQLPSEIGSIDLGASLLGVTVVGTTAYVAGGTAGLFLVDVGNPLNMKLLGSVKPPGVTVIVAVSGTVAYVAAVSGGLQVVDVSDPAAPAVLGYYDLDDAYGVSVVGGAAYVADLGVGLRIFDVSDPTTPVLLDTVSVYGDALVVHAVRPTVYVAASGLRIVDVGGSPVTTAPTTAGPTPTGAPAPAGAATPGPTSGVTTPAPSAPASPAPTQDGETVVPTTLTPTNIPTPSPEGDDVAYWVWILVTLGVLGVLGGAAAVYFSRKQKAINMSEFNNYHNEGLVQGQGMEGVKDTPGRATVMTI